MFDKDDLIEKLLSYGDNIEEMYYPQDSGNTLSEMGDGIEDEPFEDLLQFLLEEYEADDSYYGYDSVYTIVGGDYLIVTDEAADELAERYIRDTIWAFNANFLEPYLCDGALTADQIEALRGDSCEDINDAFLAMLGDRFDEFVEDAISSDGRGQFISSYDGCENEVGNYFVYRIN